MSTRLFPVGAFACDFEGTILRVQMRMPPRWGQPCLLKRLAVEVLPAMPVQASKSGRAALEVRRSPTVAILFDTSAQLVPSRLWVGKDAETIVQIESLRASTATAPSSSIRPSQWNRGIYARAGELVVADYELTTPFPGGTTAAAIFVFEGPE